MTSSDTIEHLTRHEHPMTRKHRWRMRERVRVERRPARDKPPGLDEAIGSVHPRWRRETALGREQLGDAGQRCIETCVACTQRLVS